MPAEGAVINNPSDMTRIILLQWLRSCRNHRAEAVREAQLSRSHRAGNTNGCARNLPGFIDVGWPQGQGDHL